MTELNLLYGGGDLNNDLMFNKSDEKPKISGQQIHQIASQEPNINYEEQLQQAQMQQAQMQQAQMQQAQMQQAQMQQAQMQQAQMQQAQSYQNYKRKPEYSFWDRMNIKKSEVIKLALFSLVIVLGISIDRIGTYYLSKYVSENILTDFQEFLLRLSYPIVIFLMLWILKAI